MEKHIVYTEKLSRNKRKAFLIALKRFPQLVLEEIEVPWRPEKTPTTLEDTEEESYEKVEQLLDTDAVKKPGNIFMAIQKGVDLSEEICVLIASASYAVVHSNNDTNETLSCFSEEIFLPTKLYYLVKGGMHLYDAYGQVFGEEIQNESVPVSEFMTDEKEWVWLSRLIIATLLPLYGKRSALFELD